jgi:hypothetical protein
VEAEDGGVFDKGAVNPEPRGGQEKPRYLLHQLRNLQALDRRRVMCMPLCVWRLGLPGMFRAFLRGGALGLEDGTAGVKLIFADEE